MGLSIRVEENGKVQGKSQVPDVDDEKTGELH